MSDILILNLSAIPPKATESDYSSDMGKIKGTYTNDAPVKYILKFLNNQGKNLNKILCAVTNEAESAFEKYTETVGNFCTENNYSIPEIIKVKSNFSSSVLKPCKNIIYALNIDIVCHKCYNICSPFWTDTILKTTECILCGSFFIPAESRGLPSARGEGRRTPWYKCAWC